MSKKGKRKSRPVPAPRPEPEGPVRLVSLSLTVLVAAEGGSEEQAIDAVTENVAVALSLVPGLRMVQGGGAVAQGMDDVMSEMLADGEVESRTDPETGKEQFRVTPKGLARMVARLSGAEPADPPIPDPGTMHA